ncbi:MAG: dihydrofolate reductase [Pseudomonadota bacterium]
MDIALIWAMTESGVIGRDNTLPWRLPKDMRHFMQVTMGKPVIMGRRTLESMKAPLPGRTNIVLTRDRKYARDGVKVVHDLATALDCAQAQCHIDGVDEIMVIGGADIYALALPEASRLYVTIVYADIAGDVNFPQIDLSQWQLLSREDHPADERHTAPFSICVYARSAPES